MKNSVKIIIAVIIILVIGFAIYQANKAPGLATEQPVTTVVKHDSLVGCYVAHLAKDVYTLRIESDTNGTVVGMLAYNNFEKDSSSGAFNGTYKDGILLGDYSFNSEGMDSVRQVIFKKVGDTFVQGFGPVTVVGNKEVFSDLSHVTYDSKSTFIQSKNCIEHFVRSDKIFSFDYNSFFVANEILNKLSNSEWRQNTNDVGYSLAKVVVPRAYLSKTNFFGANLTIGRSTTTVAIKNCTLPDKNTGEKNAGSATVSGYPFTKFTSGDAGAGNFYETTSYRGIVDGDCYAVEYTIHSTNIGNYSPDQGIKEFDKPKIQNELEKIVKSIAFTKNSN